MTFKRGSKAKPFPGDQELLHRVMRYNPDTGEASVYGKYHATPRMSPHGHLMLAVPTSEDTLDIGKGRGRTPSYRLDHLAWLYMTGEWPDGWFEYVNALPTDVSIENLVFIDNEGARWWYGRQPGTMVRNLVRVEDAVDAYTSDDDPTKPVFKPRVAEGWLAEAAYEPPEDQIDPDPGTPKGEFGKDWV